MPIQECEHCKNTHNAAYTGLQAALCRQCIKQCNMAHLKILDFLREHPGVYKLTDKEKIAAGAEVPELFFVLLVKEGRFGDALHGEQEEQKPSCKTCNTELRPHERLVCTRCADSVLKKIQATSPTPTNDAVRTIADTPQRDAKYGIGKTV